MAAKKKKRLGRPPLPASERTAARVTLRLVPRERARLTELAELLDCVDVDVLRAALAVDVEALRAALAETRRWWTPGA